MASLPRIVITPPKESNEAPRFAPPKPAHRFRRKRPNSHHVEIEAHGEFNPEEGNKAVGEQQVRKCKRLGVADPAIAEYGSLFLPLKFTETPPSYEDFKAGWTDQAFEKLSDLERLAVRNFVAFFSSSHHTNKDEEDEAVSSMLEITKPDFLRWVAKGDYPTSTKDPMTPDDRATMNVWQVWLTDNATAVKARLDRLDGAQARVAALSSRLISAVVKQRERLQTRKDYTEGRL